MSWRRGNRWRRSCGANKSRAHYTVCSHFSRRIIPARSPKVAPRMRLAVSVLAYRQDLAGRKRQPPDYKTAALRSIPFHWVWYRPVSPHSRTFCSLVSSVAIRLVSVFCWRYCWRTEGWKGRLKLQLVCSLGSQWLSAWGRISRVLRLDRRTTTRHGSDLGMLSCQGATC
jgi:hypothetical protein